MTDRHQFVRFATVGMGVALFYVVFYMLLVRAGVSLWWANITAFLSAIVVQYVGQTCWTFRKRLAVPSQIGRFLTMIAIGLGISALITTVLAPRLGLRDWVAAGIVAVTLPALNYIIMNLWVFKSKKGLDPLS